jgi:hypothetical protein
MPSLAARKQIRGSPPSRRTPMQIFWVHQTTKWPSQCWHPSMHIHTAAVALPPRQSLRFMSGAATTVLRYALHRRGSCN